jgi:hypothetical protein
VGIGGWNPAEADVVLNFKRIMGRGFLVAFAMWFAFLSVAIHGLHHHSGGQCDADGMEARVVEQSGEAVHVTDADGFDEGARTDHSLCPACLFLKNCKQSANVWMSKAAFDMPGGPVLDRVDVCRVSHIVSRGFPRAPPILPT